MTMLSYDQIRTVIDPHEQKRSLSCVQSAIEMVLKLNGVVPAGEYPEQRFSHLDDKGFAPYSNIEHSHFVGHRQFRRFLVTFREIKFDTNLCRDWRQEAWLSGIEYLRWNIFPIYSFHMGGGRYHCYLGIPDKADTMQFITKPMVGHCEAEIQGRRGIWHHQQKTEILAVRYRLMHK